MVLKFFFASKNFRALATAAFALPMFGCAHVSPWERGNLADPVMRADHATLTQQQAEHIWFSREASSGGAGVGGGGCGCN